MKPADVAPFPSAPVAPLPAAVAEIGQIHFEGNIIPHPWYQHITLDSGKPDLPAIIILADIVYWYRPYQTLDQDGKPLLRKHFEGDLFQCSAAYYEKKFGLTKDQTRKALKRLEDAGYIRRENRNIVQQGILRNNVMFVEPLPPAILAITHPAVATEVTPPPAAPLSPVGDPLSPVGDPLSPVGETNTEITTETTTEISTEITTTTPNPSSTERAAGPEPARGGGGSSAQDPDPEDPEGGHGIAALESNEEQTVSREEATTARRPELTFPAKLTEREQEDIAAQVYPLPTEVAQQMLDAVQAKIQNGQVKTNPAALLRGIVRKYRTDPASFDPSLGFQIAEARRRRAEAEARLRAASEARTRVPAISNPTRSPKALQGPSSWPTGAAESRFPTPGAGGGMSAANRSGVR